MMFLAVMVAIGLFVLRIVIARPVVRRVEGVRLRAVSVAFVVSSVLGLIAIPVYLDFATANDSLRSVFDVGLARAPVRGDRLRPGDPRPGGVLCAVLRGRLGVAVGGSPRASSSARWPSWPRPSGRCWPPRRC